MKVPNWQHHSKRNRNATSNRSLTGKKRRNHLKGLQTLLDEGFRLLWLYRHGEQWQYNTKSNHNLLNYFATEDLVVEHKQVETASFNVETRVLVLPLWEKASNSIYDMLVGHEVGHALFTPNDDWFLKTDVPHGIVNVCEDARIEKLMKKYMGLAKHSIMDIVSCMMMTSLI